MDCYTSSLWAVCFLVSSGLALDCDWDSTTDPGQGLDLAFLERGALDLDQAWKDLDTDACRNACCSASNCDLVLMNTPADGGVAQCLLVKCLIQERDVCVLQPSNRSRVYRKTGTRLTWTQAKKGGERPHISPLLGSLEPKTNKSSEDTNKVSLDVGVATESAVDQRTERCGAEPLVGHCRAAFPRWYYNRQTGSCQSFIYGGCGGNKNNYLNEESCMAACAEVSLDVGVATESAVDQRTAQCTVTPDPGPCRAAFPMFYYDPNTSTCHSFIYGGCRGNQNRYDSMEECMNHCGADGRFEGRGKPRNHWTTALFLFLILAAVSALLLGTLIVITLRRHRLPCRPSSLSDKEELLPEESLSVSDRT
uniref:kunitz-type protease inhibitor 2 n=1 Tax=Semicossyphus pulcher TaxID=241346 RepID=UPI0037E8DA75